tara:strand:+ start:90 stop:551 length:462 start_codon:yes stop_codon:yes gene_type:complete
MSSEIILLEPVTRSLCHALLSAWEEGMHPPIRVTHTLRTWDEQLHLWAQGRRLDGKVWVVVDPKRVVTKAQPGESAHNYGAAFDVCFAGTDPYLHKHEVEHGTTDPLWQLLGETGVRVGLDWGGPLGPNDRFTFDRPHFQRPDWKKFKTGGQV